MKHECGFLLTLLMLTFCSRLQVTTAAEHPNVRTMVAILLTLNHYPPASEQEVLQLIAHDTATSPDARILARAMMHLHHTVRPDDNVHLQTLMKNDGTAAVVKTLARIRATLTHAPNDEEKAQFTQLLQALE